LSFIVFCYSGSRRLSGIQGVSAINSWIPHQVRNDREEKNDNKEGSAMLYLYEVLYLVSVIALSELYKNREDYNIDFQRIQLLIRVCGEDDEKITINLRRLDGMDSERFWRIFYSLLIPEISLN